jgi:energy-coupling factor transporter transmembrane protein EcfT
VAAINRADELALAMEARGYRSGAPRSCYTTIRFDGQSWLFAVGSLVLLIGVYYLTGHYA